jgi:hypothetical protein
MSVHCVTWSTVLLSALEFSDTLDQELLEAVVWRACGIDFF